MCGIAGYHRRGTDPVPGLGRLADELLLAIESRGQDATGMLALLDNGKVQLQKKILPARRFIRSRKTYRADARTVLLHTRYATRGAKDKIRNAHPHAVGTVACVHNGTIYNDREVFEAFGLERKTGCDSEAIPALINYAGWGQVGQALSLLKGGAACALVDTQHPDEVILAVLRSYPLVYAVTDNLVVWASTEYALHRAWALAFGEPLPAKCVRIHGGEMVRINGKATTERIPGLPTARPKKPSRQKKAKARRQRAGVPSTPHFPAGMPHPEYTASVARARKSLENAWWEEAAQCNGYGFEAGRTGVWVEDAITGAPVFIADDDGDDGDDDYTYDRRLLTRQDEL